MLEKAHEIKHHLVAWRRDFHAHPELSFQEFRTAAKVAEIMTALGYRVRTGVGKTGVVAEIGHGGPIFAIRADMDALPIDEQTGVDYASQNPGIMHACGHDSHTAMALGAATLLSREKFDGTVRFIFQPAEENEDEAGLSGAPRMIEDGAIEGVDAIVALHVDPHLPAGTLVVSEDSTSAGADTFYITLKSNGGHGAHPDATIDPIFLSGHLILALNAIVARRINAFEPAVLTIGAIHAGSASNVIPAKVELAGTIRYMNAEVQKIIHAEVEKAVNMIRVLGGECDLQIAVGYPPGYNDGRVIKFLHTIATEMIGPENLREPERTMGAEDFGYFMRRVPGAMFLLGVRREPEDQLHTPTFNLDEDALPLGSAMFAEAALRFFREGLG